MWEISNNGQLITFLLSAAIGGVLCFIYDFFKALVKSVKNPFLLQLVFDFLFWVISAVLTFFLLLSRTNGEVRGYVIAAEALGFLIIRFTLSKLLFKFLRKAIGSAVCFFRFLARISLKISLCVCGTITKMTQKTKKYNIVKKNS